MKLTCPKILLTGLPRTGKTTLIKKAIARMPAGKTTGFFTTEILRGGVRQGFALRGINGENGVLAHVDFKTRWRVGKYGIDVPRFEAFLGRLDLWSPKFDCIVIDEIGKMEVFSDRFCDIVRKAAASEKNFLATIAFKGAGLIAEIKQRPDMCIFEVKPSNRDKLLSVILSASD